MIMLKLVVVCGGLVVIASCIAIFAWMYNEWKYHSGDTQIRLNFDKFVNMYSISPGSYITKNYHTRYFKKGCIGRDEDHIDICFSFGDYIRYRLWLKKSIREKTLHEHDKYKKEYYESVQMDIDAFRKKHQEEIEELKEKLREDNVLK